jgi:hypothetical protein
MKRFLFCVLSLTLAACTAQPTQVTGDAWSYRLRADEVPAGWTLAGQSVLTAGDLALSEPVTTTTGLQNAQQVYLASFSPPPSSQYADFSLQIIRYGTVAEAQAGLQAETLNDEWEPVTAATVGDESRVWHFRNPEDSPDQNFYRVDFRYLNVIGSVSVFGTAQVLPNAEETLTYARQVLAKLQAEPAPPEVARLQSAQLPDVRTRLLTQAQLNEATATAGTAWRLNDQLLPGWVNNDDFPTPEAQQALNQLGRITGYQMWLIKPPAEGATQLDPVVGLFQQASAYPSPAAAAQGLKALIGLPGVRELNPAPSVGDATRAWSTLLLQETGNAQSPVVATTEIDFQVGHYVASLQVQSQPINNVTSLTVLKQNYDLAVALAQMLAKNLSE